MTSLAGDKWSQNKISSSEKDVVSKKAQLQSLLSGSLSMTSTVDYLDGRVSTYECQTTIMGPIIRNQIVIKFSYTKPDVHWMSTQKGQVVFGYLSTKQGSYGHMVIKGYTKATQSSGVYMSDEIFIFRCQLAISSHLLSRGLCDHTFLGLLAAKTPSSRGVSKRDLYMTPTR